MTDIVNDDFIPEDFNPPDAPLGADEKPMKRFKVMMRKGNNDVLEKAIFIGGEKLDWSVDVTQMMDAMKMGNKFFKVVQKDIENHFVESVSEVIGRKITAADIKEAIKFGWI